MQSRVGQKASILAHVDADEGRLGVEEELCKPLSELRLADAGGAEEQERGDGPARTKGTVWKKRVEYTSSQVQTWVYKVVGVSYGCTSSKVRILANGVTGCECEYDPRL